MNEGLSVRGLTFRYGERIALADVTFDVEPGAFCALLGPNGAGKSTLVALLTRLLVPPKGEIRVAGHDLAGAPRKSLAELGVVFQQSSIDLDLTVRQNLFYFAALHGMTGKGVAARIDAALDRLDMQERAREKARSLNGGHRRRMELARALLHEPKVLVLDEPTAGLDAASRRSITDHVHDLAEQGLCILWATHLTDEVRDGDRLVVLHQGRILENGAAGDLRDATPLADWFLRRTGTDAA